MHATIALAAFTLALLAANAGVLRDLADFARGNPAASHVVLVPLVTLGLLFRERTRIFASPHLAWRTGLLVAVAGLPLMVAGRLLSPSLAAADALSLAVSGMVVTWIGGFVAAYGPQAARAGLFPLLLLAFAIPMPTAIEAGVTEVLKVGSAASVSGLFMLTGTVFLRDGFVFELPGFAIEIADECSGIRSSVALFFTGLLGGHTFLRTSRSKVLLILAILPVAVLKNGIRIVSLSLLALHVDPAYLAGALHHDGGVVFFLLSLAMLAPLLPLLRRFEAVRLKPALAA